jgi:hypothetical protein
MSVSMRDRLLDVAATQMGLKVDPVVQKRREEQAAFKTYQAKQALGLAKVSRQVAYVGAGLTAFSIVAVMLFLAKRSVSAQSIEG